MALLTIVHELKQHIGPGGVVRKDDFKIVYIAPMKALAAEMTRNFSRRLEPLGIAVKECTGDTQLSKADILRTQMLVVTPEKWDVMTRKSTGDVALVRRNPGIIWLTVFRFSCRFRIFVMLLLFL